MNSKIFAFLIFVIAAIIALPGCHKKSAHKPLDIIKPEKYSYQTTQHGITLRAKALTQQETAGIFNGYIPRIRKFRRKPRRTEVSTIQLSIENNTQHAIQLHKDGINLPTVPYKNINFVKSSWKDAKFIGLGTLGAGFLTITGIALVSLVSLGGAICCPCAFLAPIVFSLVLTPVTSGTFFASSYYLSHRKDKQARAEIQNIISQQTVSDTITIEPQEGKHILMFVPTNKRQDQFTLTLHDIHNQKITAHFNVGLQ